MEWRQYTDRPPGGQRRRTASGFGRTAAPVTAGRSRRTTQGGGGLLSDRRCSPAQRDPPVRCRGRSGGVRYRQPAKHLQPGLCGLHVEEAPPLAVDQIEATRGARVRDRVTQHAIVAFWERDGCER